MSRRVTRWRHRCPRGGRGGGGGEKPWHWMQKGQTQNQLTRIHNEQTWSMWYFEVSYLRLYKSVGLLLLWSYVVRPSYKNYWDLFYLFVFFRFVLLDFFIDKRGGSLECLPQAFNKSHSHHVTGGGSSFGRACDSWWWGRGVDPALVARFLLVGSVSLTDWDKGHCLPTLSRGWHSTYSCQTSVLGPQRDIA